LSAAYAVDRKISLIRREYQVRPDIFRQSNERRVGVVHRQIPILLNERTGSAQNSPATAQRLEHILAVSFGQIRYARFERSQQVSYSRGRRLLPVRGCLQVAPQRLPHEFGTLQARAPAGSIQRLPQITGDANS
jgi:hypothetical protein